jgi:hypothetical protein
MLVCKYFKYSLYNATEYLCVIFMVLQMLIMDIFLLATISSIGVFRVHQEILVDHDWILFNAMTFIFSLCGRERASQASFSSFLSLAWPTPFPGKCNVFHSNCARAAGGL